MKKTLQFPGMLLLLFSALFIAGCKKEINTIPGQTTINNNNSKKSGPGAEPMGPTRQVIGSAFDNTGRLEVTIWGEYVDGKYPHAEVSVDPDFVMIGGGARVSNFSNTNSGVNALLTSAYPKDDGTFSTFVADSKEHLILYNHRLWVYVIGLKLYDFAGQPIPSSYTKTFMNITKTTSGFAPPTQQLPLLPPQEILYYREVQK